MDETVPRSCFSIPDVINASRQGKPTPMPIPLIRNNIIKNHIALENVSAAIETANKTIPPKVTHFMRTLFSLINYGRFNGINSEDALERSNKKFIRRFQKLEEIAKENNQNIADLTISELENLWNLAKIR